MLVIGEDFDLSGEARSRSDLELPASQLELARARPRHRQAGGRGARERPSARAAVARGERAGDPRNLDAGCRKAATRVADVLFGKYSPAGRLPAAFPRATGAVPFNYSANATGRPADPDLEERHGALPRPADHAAVPVRARAFVQRVRYSDLAQSTQTVAPASASTSRSRSRTPAASRAMKSCSSMCAIRSRSIARPVLELRGFKRIELAAGRAQARHLQPHARAVRVLEPARPMAHRSGPHRLLGRCVVGGPARQWFIRDHENPHGHGAGGGAAHAGHRQFKLMKGNCHADLVCHRACCSRVRRRFARPAPPRRRPLPRP